MENVGLDDENEKDKKHCHNGCGRFQPHYRRHNLTLTWVSTQLKNFNFSKNLFNFSKNFFNFSKNFSNFSKMFNSRERLQSGKKNAVMMILKKRKLMYQQTGKFYKNFNDKFLNKFL